MKRFKYSYIILLLALVLSTLGIYRLAIWLADGFSRGHITSEFSYREHIDFPSLSPEELISINLILNQPYHYLARGAQTYAFVSDDSRYVLKLIKQQHLRFSQVERLLFKLPFLSDLHQKKVLKKKRKIENFLASCLLANQELRKETAILYYHLKATEGLHPQIIVYNRLGFPYQIDLDQTEFILQKRAELITAKIPSLMHNNEINEAKLCIQDFLNLFLNCTEKGIRDRDTKFDRNMGFIGNEAIFIDVGEFYRDERLNDPSYRLDYLTIQTLSLKKWLLENYPALLQ